MAMRTSGPTAARTASNTSTACRITSPPSTAADQRTQPSLMERKPAAQISTALAAVSSGVPSKTPLA